MFVSFMKKKGTKPKGKRCTVSERFFFLANIIVFWDQPPSTPLVFNDLFLRKDCYLFINLLLLFNIIVNISNSILRG